MYRIDIETRRFKALARRLLALYRVFGKIGSVIAIPLGFCTYGGSPLSACMQSRICLSIYLSFAMQPASGNVGVAFALVIAAGLSTTVGACAAFFAKLAHPKYLALGLSASAGVMLCVSDHLALCL
jgi:FtsH-binding integral membrane protein